MPHDPPIAQCREAATALAFQHGAHKLAVRPWMRSRSGRHFPASPSRESAPASPWRWGVMLLEIIMREEVSFRSTESL
jgi:hypothetical protein